MCFQVEIRAKTAGGSSDMLYLMTTNFEEKQTWVTALESVVAQVREHLLLFTALHISSLVYSIVFIIHSVISSL